MTADEALALLRGPRKDQVQTLLDEFFDSWGNVLSYHPRVMQFGCFLLWLESRGMVHLPGGPGIEKNPVAVGDPEDRKEEEAENA